MGQFIYITVLRAVTQKDFVKKFCLNRPKKNGFQPIVVNVIDFNEDLIKAPHRAIFCMATHGEGDPTDSA